MKPRYVVRSVTGFPINPDGAAGGKARTIWSVHDSLYCYQPVAKSAFGDTGRRKMRELARQLNAEEKA